MKKKLFVLVRMENQHYQHCEYYDKKNKKWQKFQSEEETLKSLKVNEEGEFELIIVDLKDAVHFFKHLVCNTDNYPNVDLENKNENEIEKFFLTLMSGSKLADFDTDFYKKFEEYFQNPKLKSKEEKDRNLSL